jgi:hypothetical protein
MMNAERKQLNETQEPGGKNKANGKNETVLDIKINSEFQEDTSDC